MAPQKAEKKHSKVKNFDQFPAETEKNHSKIPQKIPNSPPLRYKKLPILPNPARPNIDPINAFTKMSHKIGPVFTPKISNINPFVFFRTN
ncbi:MAG: hypothetical protein K9M57_07860 [Phycisphaerae bacterium]|nr:hypothetical protein [Phycisphaerae bacterium]